MINAWCDWRVFIEPQHKENLLVRGKPATYLNKHDPELLAYLQMVKGLQLKRNKSLSREFKQTSMKK